MSALAVLSWEMRVECPHCGVEFASVAVSMRRRDGKSFYCPNGHSMSWTETNEQRLKKEVERKDRELINVRQSLEWEKSQRQTSEKRRIAQKAQTTRARNQLKRVKNGVCPCCNRTFQNLLRHMGTQHPDYEGKK